MNIKTEAMAFRIWAFAKPRAWDCSIHEISDAVGETPQRISAICRTKGWNARLRSSGPFYLDTTYNSDGDRHGA